MNNGTQPASLPTDLPYRFMNVYANRKEKRFIIELMAAQLLLCCEGNIQDVVWEEKDWGQKRKQVILSEIFGSCSAVGFGTRMAVCVVDDGDEDDHPVRLAKATQRQRQVS